MIDNKKIWELRYSQQDRIAKYPFDQVISMVMRRFASYPQRNEVKILDYGCGGGANFWFLIREGFNGYACDVSPTALHLTKECLNQEGLNLPNNHFSLLEEQKLPYPDSFFSAIIDRESLCQSRWTEIQSRVKEFSRILVPGGWYFGVNFSNHHPGISDSDYLGCGDYDNFRSGLFKNQGGRHLFSLNEIQELFSGWHIECIAEQSTVMLIGKSTDFETSEYIIMCQKQSSQHL